MMHDAASSLGGLVVRAQAGDRKAFDQLLAQSQEWVFRFIRGLTRDEHLAEETTQEVFLLIFRKLRWLHDPSLYRHWVYRIAARESLRRLRRERREHFQSLEEDSASPRAVDPPEELASAEIARLLNEKIRELPPNSRAVVVLHYGEGLTLSEIGAILDVPIGTVKSRLAYALGCLRRRLSSHGSAPTGRCRSPD